MNLRESLLKLLSGSKGIDPSELTQRQQGNIELLEQRIMFSASQCGAALGDGAMDSGDFENLCCDNGIEELFGKFEQGVNEVEIENFVNELLGESSETAADLNFSGTSGEDQFKGLAGNDNIDGNAGQDRVYSGDGDDVARGGAGDDFVAGNQGRDYVSGGQGNDEVRGNEGNDIVQGNEGNDVLYGNGGSDILQGGDGNDRLVGGAGDDILVGGRGHDTAYFNNSFDGFSFELLANGDLQVVGSSGSDIVSNVEFLEFTDGTVSVSEIVAAQRGEGPAPTVEATQVSTPVPTAEIEASGPVVEGNARSAVQAAPVPEGLSVTANRLATRATTLCPATREATESLAGQATMLSTATKG